MSVYQITPVEEKFVLRQGFAPAFSYIRRSNGRNPNPETLISSTQNNNRTLSPYIVSASQTGCSPLRSGDIQKPEENNGNREGAPILSSHFITTLSI